MSGEIALRQNAHETPVLIDDRHAPDLIDDPCHERAGTVAVAGDDGVHDGLPHAAAADVLRLAARGHTTREIADRLFISPKTADHHIQHIYGKIGVSTRAAAALWAMEHTVVG